MFVLAHLSDPHLPPLPRPRLRELVGKRATGLANWMIRRRFEHQAHVLESVLRDLATQQADHIAVTGDLVNLALASEFPPARLLLERIGPPDRVTLVPGNHDAYAASTAEHAGLHWHHYMTDDAHTAVAARFPFLRRRGPVALIGLSTALPTGPFRAWGRLGPAQVDALDSLLQRLAGERLFRVVLLHHPPCPFPGDRHKRLVDADRLRAMLARHDVELILHGHSHLGSLSFIDGRSARIPVAGVPSASAIGHHDEPAGLNLFRIEDAGNGWRCERIRRTFDAGNGELRETGRDVVQPPP